jgi:hypothetical protein
VIVMCRTSGGTEASQRSSASPALRVFSASACAAPTRSAELDRRDSIDGRRQAGRLALVRSASPAPSGAAAGAGGRRPARGGRDRPRLSDRPRGDTKENAHHVRIQQQTGPSLWRDADPPPLTTAAPLPGGEAWVISDEPIDDFAPAPSEWRRNPAKAAGILAIGVALVDRDAGDHARIVCQQREHRLSGAAELPKVRAAPAALRVAASAVRRMAATASSRAARAAGSSPAAGRAGKGTAPNGQTTPDASDSDASGSGKPT